MSSQHDDVRPTRDKQTFGPMLGSDQYDVGFVKSEPRTLLD
jgi:hypothetical protein